MRYLSNSIISPLLVIASIMISSCANVPTENVKAINFGSVLALGKLIETNPNKAAHEIDLFVRLYEMPVYENDCFIETHGICQNQYYVTVSTYDEYPETNVFKLKYKGEVVDLYWVEDNRVDYVKLMLVLEKYTGDALKNNNSLINSQFRVLVELTPKSIRQTRQ